MTRVLKVTLNLDECNEVFDVSKSDPMMRVLKIYTGFFSGSRLYRFKD